MTKATKTTLRQLKNKSPKIVEKKKSHPSKGKTHVELFGVERAAEIAAKIRKSRRVSSLFSSELSRNRKSISRHIEQEVETNREEMARIREAQEKLDRQAQEHNARILSDIPDRPRRKRRKK